MANRLLQGLLALTKRHDADAIERACEVAYSHGAWRLKTLRLLGQVSRKAVSFPDAYMTMLVPPYAMTCFSGVLT